MRMGPLARLFMPGVVTIKRMDAADLERRTRPEQRTVRRMTLYSLIALRRTQAEITVHMKDWK